MTTLYIFTTVFGIGIIIIDLFMTLSGSSDEGTESDSGDAEEGYSDDISSDDAIEMVRQSVDQNGSVISHHKKLKMDGVLMKMLGGFRHALWTHRFVCSMDR